MLKRKLFFYFSLFGLFFWTCTSSPKVVSTGSLIENRNQSGRLEVANIIDVSIKSKQISLYCDIYNTGNSDLVLPDLSETIQVLFDDDELKKNNILQHKESLLTAIKSIPTLIKVGKFKFKQKVKFKIDVSEETTEQSVAFFGDISYEDNSSYIDEKHCADLFIDSIFIIKRSKNWTKVGYRITNIGKGPANIFIKGFDDYNNLSIKFYLSRSGKLTRGSILIGESFMDSNKSNKNGVLKPGESYIGKSRLDLVKYTRFSPTLILSIDEYNKVRECDETNNTSYTSIER